MRCSDQGVVHNQLGVNRGGLHLKCMTIKLCYRALNMSSNVVLLHSIDNETRGGMLSTMQKPTSIGNNYISVVFLAAE